MSQFNVVRNAVTADQIYFDVTVTNFQSTTTVPPIFYYNDGRTMPFIDNPEDYYLSIQRFTLETGTIPVFVPSIQPGPSQTNPNLTIYSITLEYTDAVLGTATSGQVFLQWIPQDKSAQVPPAPSQTATKTQVNDTGYYNCYSLGYLTTFISGYFGGAMNLLKADALAKGITLPSQFAPQMIWDTTGNVATIYADVLGYDQNPSNPAEQIKIYWNAPLFELFNTFPAFYLGYTGVTLGKNYQILPYFTSANGLLPILTPTIPSTEIWQGIPVYQEVSTIANITPVSAIVFTSNTLPIEPSQVSTPLVYNNASILALGGNNADIANIVTDLVTDSGIYRPNVVYTPTAEYRLITLYGNRPLYNLDLQIFYRIKTGQLIPIRIASGQGITIKLAFLKKSSRMKHNGA